MIIKQTRIAAGQASQAAAYAAGLSEHENDSVAVLSGDADELAFYADAMTDRYENKYGLRHFIISPSEKLSADQIRTILNELNNEWGIGADRPFLLTKHEKPGSTERDAHYHLLVAENDSDGSVLDYRNAYPRNEKVCRKLEAIFGHEITKGRYNVAVLHALSDEIKQLKNDKQDHSELENIKNIIERSNIQFEQLPSPTISAGAKGKAQRLGIDIDELARDVRRAAALDDFRQVQQLLKAEGLDVRPGNKEGVLLVYKDDEKIGSLSRLCDLTKEQSASFYKDMQQNNNQFYKIDYSPARSTSAPGAPGAGSKTRLSKSAKRNAKGHADSAPSKYTGGTGGAMLNTSSNMSDEDKKEAQQRFSQNWASSQHKFGR